VVIKLLSKDGGVMGDLMIVTTLGNPGSNSNFATEKAIRDAIIAALDITTDTVHAASSKSPPVDADELVLLDSVASYGLKKLTWANLKAAMSIAAHKISHENNGSDEINVAGLSGVLADAQTPAAHNQAASTINSGVFDPTRLPAPTLYAQGAMPAFDGVATHFYNGTGGLSIPAGGSTKLPFVTVGFGAGYDYVCDGTADDVQIQQAIDALPSGGTMFLGPGLFNTVATLVCNHAIEIEGVGPTTTIISASSAAASVLQLGDVSNHAGKVSLRNISFTRPIVHPPVSGRIGLYLAHSGDPANTFVAENCWFTRSYYNVKLGIDVNNRWEATSKFVACEFGAFGEDGYYSVWQHAAIEATYIGCAFRSASGSGSAALCSDSYGNDAWIDSCYFQSTADAFGYPPGQYGIKWNGIVLHLVNCQFEGFHVARMHVSQTLDMSINGCNFGGGNSLPGAYGIHLVPTEGEDIYNVRIVGNILSYSSDPGYSPILIEKSGSNICRDIIIANNHIEQESATGINVWDAKNIVIANNEFHVHGIGYTAAYGISINASSAMDTIFSISGNVMDFTGITGGYCIFVGDNARRGTINGNTINAAGGTALYPATSNSYVSVGTNYYY
jgi:hypothetical protein